MSENHLPNRFQTMALTFPDRVAVHYEENQYTYRELDLLSDRLAAYLKGEGIGPGSVVSILIPRCEYMAIAALGVLKTGAAYEPLDASHPVKRIRSMIEEADAALVIVSRELEHLLADPRDEYEGNKLYMEDISTLPEPEVPVRPEIQDEDLFVILFTSGSTGEPKGILLTHQNIASLTNWFLPYYQVDENSRVGQYASFVFDMSIEGLLLPLAAGASVHIIPDAVRTDLFALKQFFDDNEITHCSMTTQMGRQFALLMGDRVRTLQHLTVGGESLKAIRPPKHFTLYNGYGPSECTLIAAIQPVKKAYSGDVPLGRPISEVEIYILDKQGRRVSDGEIGELCIAGPHVARGYLNRPGLTDDVFTDNPYSDDPGYQRLYHTGDLARLVTDTQGGNEKDPKPAPVLEYAGRMDRQVKIRGFRIEPGEIEEILLNCPGIRDALVIPKELGGQKVLAAYYLSDGPCREDALKERILMEKPSYMLPAFFVRMKEFPLNTNGKVDLVRLPEPAGSDLGLFDRKMEEPVTETEKKLALLISEILTVEQVGRGDNFYLLGGNSITAASLLYQIYEKLHVKISIKDILACPVLWRLAERIDTLAPADGAEDKMEIEPLIAKQEYYEVSSAQERIYTAQNMLSPADSTYLLYLTIVTEGQFEKDRVKEVLSILFSRHESFRTSFHFTEEAGLVQKIEEADMSWIREAVGRSYGKNLSLDCSLDHAPLFSWKYEEKALYFCWHHIISDGNSVVLFAQEFMDLYQGGKPEPLRIHQKDYAAYERSWSASALHEKLRSDWQKAYLDFTDVRQLSLPADGSVNEQRPAGHHQILLQSQLSERIDLFCRDNNVTAYMFLLAVFSLLLSRYSGQERMVIGTIMNGRELSAARRLQGMFANTVPLFLEVTGDQSLAEYLRRVSAAVLSAMDRQSVPLEEIAADFEEAGGYQRTSHGHLLFDVLYVMQSMDPKLPDLEGKRTWMEFPVGNRAMYDLTLETERREDGYHCDFEYDENLISADSISWLARHYQTLIESWLEEDYKSQAESSSDHPTLSELGMIDDEERELLLRGFQPDHDSALFAAGLKTVIHLFEERVADHPEKTAVVFGDASLTYRQLWARSAELTRQILTRISEEDPGASAEDRTERRIVIIAERGLSMIVSIWAVLRSGCAYVPVSPSYPRERTWYLLKDCQPSLIINCLPAYRNPFAGTIPAEGEQKDVGWMEKEVPVIYYPEDALSVEEPMQVQLGPSVRPDSPAYLIYTSGTTGQPKAVVVEHRQLAALLLAYRDIYQLTDRDRVLQFADYVFDQSVWEIFHILTVGGTLCMIPEEIVKDPEALAGYCHEKNVTVTMMTPAFLRMLDPDAFPSLRLVDVGGDEPDKDLLLAWSKGRRVFNTYGPTETTVNASSFLFSDRGVAAGLPPLAEGKIPIGKSVPGSRIYILKGENPCGIGVPGELCIAGAQVARGYYHREDLSAEKFVPDPFFSGRMYRSGDLARLLPDGNIEFMGRMDDQVKLRGFRIEPKEIESVIRKLPSIRDVIVRIQKADGGEDSLCAYYTAEGRKAPSPDELRGQLEKVLPLYMVPAYLIRLASLPLTIGGKVDYKALPKPQPGSDDRYAEAVTPEELDLREAFCRILKLSRISVTDDFLSLGGDSIKAIRIAALLREKGYQLSGNSLMKYRSIRKLAPLLKQDECTGEELLYEEYRQVIPTPVMRQFEASVRSAPNWFNQSMILQLIGNPGQAAVEKALQSLVGLHGMLRMIRQTNAIMIRRPEEMAAFSLPVYEGLSPAEREEVCTALHQEISPEKGEVMKASLFINGQAGSRETRLFLAFHHYVVDEVSWGILLGDLDRLIGNQTDGLPGEGYADFVSERTVSFGQWSEKLWRYRDSQTFLPEKAYWESLHEKMAGQKDSGRKWLAKYRDKRTDSEGTDYIDQVNAPGERSYASLYRTVPAEVRDAISRNARDCWHCGSDILILAGLILAVQELDGPELPERLPVQLESHGRGEIPESSGKLLATDRTVGWFTAIYPVFFDLAKTEEDQILLVKEALLGVPNQGIGYGLLYDDIKEIGGIVFNYLGQEREEDYHNICLLPETSGLELDPANGDPNTISLDIRGQESGLEIACRYDTVYDPERIGRLLDLLVGRLALLAGRNLVKPVYSPSDLCLNGTLCLSDWKNFTRHYDPENIQAIASLTPVQEGMLYRYMAEPDSRAYYLQDRLLVFGEWREKEFKKALRLCSIRFDALRLRFLYQDMEEVRQIILKEQIPEYIDASSSSFDQILGADRQRGFLLDQDSPVRFTRYREETEDSPSGDGCTGLLVSVHHAVMDGWSYPVFIETLMGYYRKLCREEEEDKLAKQVMKEREEAASFEDYLRDRSRLNQYAGLRQWETYLAGLADGCGLSLPSSHKEDREEEGRKGEQDCIRLSLDQGLAKKLTGYIRKQHVTAGTFFGVVWALLLGFENQVNDVVYGETVSGRNRDMDGISSAVGMLIDTIPVRVCWDEDTRADELMKKRQEDYARLQPWEGVSLSRIGSRTGLHGRLVQTLYVYENYPEGENADSYRLLPVHEEIDYDLGLSVEEREGFHLSLSYDSLLYPGDYMGLLFGRLEHLVRQILDHPGIRVWALARIPDREKKYMLGEIAGRKLPYPDVTFLDMVYQQVMACPGRQALTMDGDSLTYGELWDSACHLADQIGFGPERYIAIVTDRSFDLIIAMLAVLLSGAAYVPVDKDYPLERMRTVLCDSRPELVICREQILCPDGREREEIKTLFAELGLKVISHIPGKSHIERWRMPPSSKDLGDRIAYMIYTSGTTGRPKGVEVDHKALSDMIQGNEASYGSFREDVVLLLLNPVFDASIQQIFPVLAQGGCLSVIPADKLESPDQIVDYCVRNQVTVVSATNALLRTFSYALEGKLTLKLLITGGDEAEPAFYEEYARHTRMLVNDYGPTETCVHAASYIYRKEEGGRVPLGRPYPNKRIYIIQDGHLCGIGQKGEICIAGAGLARGYHGQPELTEEVFTENPYDGGIMYRTGDIGLFGPDRNLYFEGRKDTQVKIRGFRIETGEIEACIKEYPGVREAVVLPIKEAGKETYLAGYITWDRPDPLSDEEGAIDTVRLYLESRLPHYMVPAFMTGLPSLPLTANGKVDKKKLPVPMAGTDRNYLPPKHYFEERIAALFERILKVERAGRNDSFFELGGSSIDLMKLLSGLSGLNIRAADVFSHPTVRGLGKLLRKRFLKEQEEEENCILLQEGERNYPSIYCIPPSGGMSMCYLPLLRELKYPGSVWGLTDMKYRYFGKMDLPSLETYDPGSEDLRPSVIKTYEKALEGTFQAGDILFGYSQGGCIAHALARYLEEKGKHPGKLIMLEAVPFSAEEPASFDSYAGNPFNREESQVETIRAVETIFFGHSELPEGDHPVEGSFPKDSAGEIPVKEALIRLLRAHDEENAEKNEGLLHALFETSLVYRVNTCMPFITKGKSQTVIDSVLLVEKDRTDAADCSRVILKDDPWVAYGRPGKAYGIVGDMNDHLVFLSKYRKKIAECMRILLNL